MKNWFVFIPLAALALLVIVGVVLLTRDGERETFSTGLVGQPAPAYALANLDAGAPEVTNAAREGRPYVINLFASWCAPCRAEHPLLMALQAEGVEIVGVAYKDRPENAARFLQGLGNPFADVGLDPEGRVGLELGLQGVPETFVVGADGRIVAAYRGPLTQDAIEREIRPALR
ncbi:MAG: DsbE family thiol:disulfide interchange protein [Hyphomonadaceae bacterium]|nr:DsbE family thiol:disulfide interchange protein [Hyphomonadaceae bacterium]